MEHNSKDLKSFFTEDKERYPFYFDLSPDQLPLKIDAYMQARTPLEEGLLIAIQAANQQLALKGLSLVKDVRLYKTRLAGKNFKPKTDLPSLSLYQKICDLKVSEIAVQIVNKDKAIVKKVQKVEKSTEKTLIQPEKRKQWNAQEKQIASQMEKVAVTKKEEGSQEKKV